MGIISIFVGNILNRGKLNLCEIFKQFNSNSKPGVENYVYTYVVFIFVKFKHIYLWQHYILNIVAISQLDLNEINGITFSNKASLWRSSAYNKLL